MKRHTDKQTVKQTDKQTDKYTDKQTDKHVDIFQLNSSQTSKTKNIFNDYFLKRLQILI